MTMSVSSVSFGYTRGQKILDRVSFTAKEGEILSLIGPNGTGKTTLLKCVSHIYQPWEGEVKVDGMSVAQMPAKTRARCIGYVPQSTHSAFPIRVADAVMMGRMPFAVNKFTESDKEIVFSILRRMELEEFAFRNLNEMSGGERQRVYIARALAQEPKVLLLDEPTSSLDMKNQLFTLELIRKLADEKKLAVIMSIHDLNLTAMFSDQVLMLKGASVYAAGSPPKVLDEEKIRNTYGVNTVVSQLDCGLHIRLVRNVHNERLSDCKKREGSDREGL